MTKKASEEILLELGKIDISKIEEVQKAIDALRRKFENLKKSVADVDVEPIKKLEKDLKSLSVSSVKSVSDLEKIYNKLKELDKTEMSLSVDSSRFKKELNEISASFEDFKKKIKKLGPLLLSPLSIKETEKAISSLKAELKSKIRSDANKYSKLLKDTESNSKFSSKIGEELKKLKAEEKILDSFFSSLKSNLQSVTEESRRLTKELSISLLSKSKVDKKTLVSEFVKKRSLGDSIFSEQARALTKLDNNSLKLLLAELSSSSSKTLQKRVAKSKYDLSLSSSSEETNRAINEYSRVASKLRNSLKTLLNLNSEIEAGLIQSTSYSSLSERDKGVKRNQGFSTFSSQEAVSDERKKQRLEEKLLELKGKTLEEQKKLLGLDDSLLSLAKKENVSKRELKKLAELNASISKKLYSLTDEEASSQSAVLLSKINSKFKTESEKAAALLKDSLEKVSRALNTKEFKKEIEELDNLISSKLKEVTKKKKLLIKKIKKSEEVTDTKRHDDCRCENKIVSILKKIYNRLRSLSKFGGQALQRDGRSREKQPRQIIETRETVSSEERLRRDRDKSYLLKAKRLSSLTKESNKLNHIVDSTEVYKSNLKKIDLLYSQIEEKLNKLSKLEKKANYYNAEKALLQIDKAKKKLNDFYLKIKQVENQLKNSAKLEANKLLNNFSKLEKNISSFKKRISSQVIDDSLSFKYISRINKVLKESKSKFRKLKLLDVDETQLRKVERIIEKLEQLRHEIRKKAKTSDLSKIIEEDIRKYGKLSKSVSALLSKYKEMDRLKKLSVSISKALRANLISEDEARRLLLNSTEKEINASRTLFGWMKKLVNLRKSSISSISSLSEAQLKLDSLLKSKQYLNSLSSSSRIKLPKGTKAPALFGDAAMAIFSRSAPRLIAGGAAGLATYESARRLREAIQLYADFTDKVLEAQSVLTQSKGLYEELEKAARQAGVTTRYTASESATALKLLAQAGFSAKESIAALEPTLHLAAAGSVSLSKATEVSINTLKNFGLSAEEMKRVADKIAYAAKSGNVTIEDLGSAIRYAGAMSKNANLSLSETLALLTQLGSAGMKGSMGGTAIRNLITRLYNLSSAAKKSLQKLGVEIYDSSGKVRNLIDILSELAEKKRLFEEGRLPGVSDFSKELSTIFRTRGSQAAMALISDDNILKVKELALILEKSSDGFAKAAADLRESGIGGELRLLRSKTEELQISFIKQLELKDVIKVLNEKMDSLIQALNVSQKIGFKETMPLFTSSGGAYLSLFGGVTSSISVLSTILKSSISNIQARLAAMSASLTGISSTLTSFTSSALPSILSLGLFAASYIYLKKKRADEEKSIKRAEYELAMADLAERLTNRLENENKILELISKSKTLLKAGLSSEDKLTEAVSVLKNLEGMKDLVNDARDLKEVLRTEKQLREAINEILKKNRQIEESYYSKFSKSEDIRISEFNDFLKKVIKEKGSQPISDKTASAIKKIEESYYKKKQDLNEAEVKTKLKLKLKVDSKYLKKEILKELKSNNFKKAFLSIEESISSKLSEIYSSSIDKLEKTKIGIDFIANSLKDLEGVYKKSSSYFKKEIEDSYKYINLLSEIIEGEKDALLKLDKFFESRSLLSDFNELTSKVRLLREEMSSLSGERLLISEYGETFSSLVKSLDNIDLEKLDSSSLSEALSVIQKKYLSIKDILEKYKAPLEKVKELNDSFFKNSLSAIDKWKKKSLDAINSIKGEAENTISEINSILKRVSEFKLDTLTSESPALGISEYIKEFNKELNLAKDNRLSLKERTESLAKAEEYYEKIVELKKKLEEDYESAKESKDKKKKRKLRAEIKEMESLFSKYYGSSSDPAAKMEQALISSGLNLKKQAEVAKSEALRRAKYVDLTSQYEKNRLEEKKKRDILSSRKREILTKLRVDKKELDNIFQKQYIIKAKLQILKPENIDEIISEETKILQDKYNRVYASDISKDERKNRALNYLNELKNFRDKLVESGDKKSLSLAKIISEKIDKFVSVDLKNLIAEERTRVEKDKLSRDEINKKYNSLIERLQEKQESLIDKQRKYSKKEDRITKEGEYTIQNKSEFLRLSKLYTKLENFSKKEIFNPEEVKKILSEINALEQTLSEKAKIENVDFNEILRKLKLSGEKERILKDISKNREAGEAYIKLENSLQLSKRAEDLMRDQSFSAYLNNKNELLSIFRKVSEDLKILESKNLDDKTRPEISKLVKTTDSITSFVKRYEGLEKLYSKVKESDLSKINIERLRRLEKEGLVSKEDLDGFEKSLKEIQKEKEVINKTDPSKISEKDLKIFSLHLEKLKEQEENLVNSLDRMLPYVDKGGPLINSIIETKNSLFSLNSSIRGLRLAIEALSGVTSQPGHASPNPASPSGFSGFNNSSLFRVDQAGLVSNSINTSNNYQTEVKKVYSSILPETEASLVLNLSGKSFKVLTSAEVIKDLSTEISRIEETTL